MSITREQELALLDPAAYHRDGYPWPTWEQLRREDPIHHVEQRDNGGPYWAVTRYADIVEIERNVEVFKNGPRLTMGSTEDQQLRLIVNMDPPDHTAHRALAGPFFTPRNIEWAKRYAEEIVGETLDRAMARNGEVIDLQEDVANTVPTAVISAYLGAPRELWPRIVAWTNQIINASDPDYAAGKDARALVGQATMEMIKVHAATFAERRRAPRDDLMSALVQGQVNGRPLSDVELYSWAIILTTAGHETTQSSFSMAVHTLLQHPEQLARLRAEPELLPRAVDELLRWVSPAIHFVRTPDRDIEVRGRPIRAGEHLVMFYPSANRDAAVFAEPDRLDLARAPNRHLAFGTGPHVCLGMHLAKLELRVMLEQFLQRVARIEIVAPPTNVHTNTVGGYKKFPVRLQVRPRR